MKVVLVATVIMSLIAIVYLYNTLSKKEINLKQCHSDMMAQKTSGDRQMVSLKDKCQSDMTDQKTSGDRQIESLTTMYDKCQSDMTAQKTSGDRQIKSLQTEIDKLSGFYAKSQLDIISSDNTITALKKSNYDLESQVVSLKSKMTPMMAPTFSPDPRAKLTQVIRSIRPESGTTYNYGHGQVTEDFSDLERLVKSITGGQTVSRCVDQPPFSGFLWSKTGSEWSPQAGMTHMQSITKNIIYATKGALNIAAKNENFYDMAALFCKIGQFAGMVGINNITYDSNNMISTASILFYVRQLSISNFANLSIKMPTASDLGNDSDLISFMEKMVPVLNSFTENFLPRLNQQQTVFDADIFGKLVTFIGVLYVPLIVPGIMPFGCTSTMAPTTRPTMAPTMAPTYAPTMAPTMRPTLAPTMAPTMRPTMAPTMAPTMPPTNLTKVIKESVEYRPGFSSSELAQAFLREWSNLIALVKSITGKLSLCIDMPSNIEEAFNSANPIILTNIYYVTKDALNISATNGNFYDIVALFLQSFKCIQGGTFPMPIKATYDSNGLLSTASMDDSGSGKPLTLSWFLRTLQPSISISPSMVGNDPDLISFAEKIVRFYNSFVPTLSSMDQSTSTFDINMFCKLFACLFVFGMIAFKMFIPPFVCTSRQIY